MAKKLEVQLGYDNAVEVLEHLVTKRLNEKGTTAETKKLYKAALNDLKLMRAEAVGMDKVREGFALIDMGLNRQ
jgi:hypothetical protein